MFARNPKEYLLWDEVDEDVIGVDELISRRRAIRSASSSFSSRMLDDCLWAITDLLRNGEDEVGELCNEDSSLLCIYIDLRDSIFCAILRNLRYIQIAIHSVHRPTFIPLEEQIYIALIAIIFI